MNSIQLFENRELEKVSKPVATGVYINEDLLKKVREKVGRRGLSKAVNEALLAWISHV